ncbi:MAG TPA: type IV secretory system conjugative DNA transfer family protein [Candidatus Limnocylindrales bacterium]|nr:type IV secretory system conjugative DNA transfer family protein [Candidatus Limnocylindrales bacterium]
MAQPGALPEPAAPAQPGGTGHCARSAVEITSQRHRHRLLLMLDEFPSLGRLDFFQTQLAYLAGYGIKAFLIAQDLSLLYAAYGHHESVVSNCPIRVAYAPNKVETARLLSDMAGSMTVHKETRTYTGNRLNPVLMHVMASEKESQRPLLTPDEAMRLPEDASLIFVAGGQPILGTKFRYFRSPALAARARVPAPPESDRLPGAGPGPWASAPVGPPLDPPETPIHREEEGREAAPPVNQPQDAASDSTAAAAGVGGKATHEQLLDQARAAGSSAEQQEAQP